MESVPAMHLCLLLLQLPLTFISAKRRLKGCMTDTYDGFSEEYLPPTDSLILILLIASTLNCKFRKLFFRVNRIKTKNNKEIIKK